MSVYVHVQYMQMRYKNEFGIFQVLQKSSEIYLKVYFQDTPRIDIYVVRLKSESVTPL